MVVKQQNKCCNAKLEIEKTGKVAESTTPFTDPTVLQRPRSGRLCVIGAVGDMVFPVVSEPEPPGAGQGGKRGGIPRFSGQ